MLVIRPLISSDYELLCEWWRQWGWEPISKDFLPQNGEGGMMVMDGDVPVVAGFLFTTNSAIAWVEFVISNKEYKNRENRKNAIFVLIKSLTDIAQNSGFKYVYTLLKHNGLMKVYEENGYVKGDTATEMIKIF